MPSPVSGVVRPEDKSLWLPCGARRRDAKVAGAVSFLVMAAGALVVGLGYHGHW